MKHRVCTPW